MKLVYVTIQEQDAKPFAKTIVEKRLAACVNLVSSVQSIYAWQGQICSDAETLMLIKTSDERIDELRQYVNDHHPYDTPEFVVVNVQEGHSARDYLQWVDASTRPSKYSII